MNRDRPEMDAAIAMDNTTLAKFLFAKLCRPETETFWNLRQWNQFKFVVRGLHRMATSGSFTNSKRCLFMSRKHSTFH